MLMLVAYLAGLLGSITGLGGGAIIIPVLVLLFHINIHYAMGASLISVIATSSGAAAAYLKEGYTNVRIGMFLEMGAVTGALLGALLLTALSPSIIAAILGVVLLFSAYATIKRKEESELERESHAWAKKFKLEGTYPTKNGMKSYFVFRVPQALGLMTLAGAISGLLGIGSGSIKVLAMDQAMKLPYKVSTTTSNFMIGITAATSAGIYFSHGYINPEIAFPVVIGVTVGAFTGAKLLQYIHTQALRIIFGVVLILMAIELIMKSLTGVI